jgi:hypothetical protein
MVYNKDSNVSVQIENFVLIGQRETGNFIDGLMKRQHQQLPAARILNRKTVDHELGLFKLWSKE